jgi:hypothetical protein
MNPFPLYDSLLGLTSQNKEFNLIEVCNKVNKLNSEQQDIIAALIYHHSLTEKIKNKKGNIPYNGRTQSDNKIGICYAMDQLPEQLQKIIAYYAISIIVS